MRTSDHTQFWPYRNRLMAICAFLLGMTCVSPIAQHCLKIDAGENGLYSLFDPEHGAWINTTARGLPQHWYDYVSWSPDKKNVAYFKVPESSQNNAITQTLFVQSVTDGVPIEAARTIQNNLPAPTVIGMEVDRSTLGNLWSADSRYLVYRWQSGPLLTQSNSQVAGQYLGAASVDGRQRWTTYLPNGVGLDSELDGSSADSAYFALLTRDSKRDTLEFRTVQGLSAVSGPTQILPNGCITPYESIQMFCAIWSPQGSWVAYVIPDTAGHPQLVLHNIAQGKRMEFPLPKAFAHDTIIWSPNGQYAAVTAYDNTSSTSQTTIFSIDGTTFTTIEGIAIEGSWYHPAIWWSGDSRALLYTQKVSGTAQGSGNAIAYHLDSGQTITLSSSIDLISSWGSSLKSNQYALLYWVQNGQLHGGVVDINTGIQVSLRASKALQGRQVDGLNLAKLIPGAIGIKNGCITG